MRFTLVSVLLFVVSASLEADDATKTSRPLDNTKAPIPAATANRTLEGDKSRFPAKAIAEGVKASIGVLESCHSSDDVSYTVADLKKAQKGDHVRLAFARPVTVTVLGEKFKVSELVYSAGVFWLRSGNTVVRCSKYEFAKWKPFEAWFRQSLPAD